MINRFILAVASAVFATNVLAFDVNLFANNKEAVSRLLQEKHERAIENWLSSPAFRTQALERSRNTLSSALKTFQKRKTYCDIGFSRLLKDRAKYDSLISNEDDFYGYVSYLRKANLIDDIFFMNIMLSEKLDQSIQNSIHERKPLVGPINRKNERTEDLDLEKLYADFKQWPDEVSNCSLGRFFNIALNLTWKDKKDRDRLLQKTNYLAFERKIISLETFNKLEVIRKQKALDWPVYTKGYIDIVTNAKDKLAPRGKPELDPSMYSTKYVTRRERLTQRGRLYKIYDSTQIVILSEIIRKTAKRMDAHYVGINFQYDDSPDSETETYVLSPMERYRLAIKMLRKDMGEVMRSDLFQNTTIEYEDLVTAAYETGLIKSQELELILKFEDFWNPKEPKWKIYSNFAFSTLGTAAFYLPAPWNIVGAIALVVTETQLENRQKKPDADDNWNVVI